jgi:hypothetical protein
MNFFTSIIDPGMRMNLAGDELNSPVILSAAKDLSAYRDRPFAALRVTRQVSKRQAASHVMKLINE